MERVGEEEGAGESRRESDYFQTLYYRQCSVNISYLYCLRQYTINDVYFKSCSVAFILRMERVSEEEGAGESRRESDYFQTLYYRECSVMQRQNRAGAVRGTRTSSRTLVLL